MTERATAEERTRTRSAERHRDDPSVSAREEVRALSTGEQAGCLIVELGPDGDIRYVSPAAERLFPDLRKQGLQHPWLSPFSLATRPSAEVEGDKAVVQVDFGGRTYQMVVCTTGREGNRRICAVDITERARTEDDLRQTRDELQAIYDAMLDGLLIADVTSKRFVRANPAICSMLGYSEE